jgi:hypothetical protein
MTSLDRDRVTKLLPVIRSQVSLVIRSRLPYAILSSGSSARWRTTGRRCPLLASALISSSTDPSFLEEAQTLAGRYVLLAHREVDLPDQEFYLSRNELLVHGPCGLPLHFPPLRSSSVAVTEGGVNNLTITAAALCTASSEDHRAVARDLP